MTRSSPSLPHRHVAAVLGTIRELGLEELIDPVPATPKTGCRVGCRSSTAAPLHRRRPGRHRGVCRQHR
jgi:hypothetical protein